MALLGASQTFTGVNVFNNNVGVGIAAPFRNFQVRAGADRILGILPGVLVGGVGSGMTIESVNDANNANEPLEFRGNPNVFTTGNVVIGGTEFPEMLEVDGRDTAARLDVRSRIRNLNDAAGGFVGEAFGALQLGMYNPAASTQGVMPAGVKRSFFGFDVNGNVGSLANNFGSPAYRNLLDDGNGNMSAARELVLCRPQCHSRDHLFRRQHNDTCLWIAELLRGTRGRKSDDERRDNTATGTGALQQNATGSGNVANGSQALVSNTTGYANTADGYSALHFNTFGTNNTAIGASALYANTFGICNTAVGGAALYANTTGSGNTAHGAFALYPNTTGYANTASGAFAQYFNVTGSGNTANGAYALWGNTTGSLNTAVGYWALFQSADAALNTAIGVKALYSDSTGSNNIACGYMGGYNVTTGSNNIEIGNAGAASDDSTINIGTQGIQTSTAIAGIFGATAASGVPVYVTATGKLGTLTSSARFKTNIQTMDHASEVCLRAAGHLPLQIRHRPARHSSIRAGGGRRGKG